MITLKHRFNCERCRKSGDWLFEIVDHYGESGRIIRFSNGAAVALANYILETQEESPKKWKKTARNKKKTKHPLETLRSRLSETGMSETFYTLEDLDDAIAQLTDLRQAWNLAIISKRNP